MSLERVTASMKEKAKAEVRMRHLLVLGITVVLPFEVVRDLDRQQRFGQEQLSLLTPTKTTDQNKEPSQPKENQDNAINS